MDTRTATSAQSFVHHPAQPHPGRRKTEVTTNTSPSGYARGSQTAGLSHDVLGVVNASRIAALQGVVLTTSTDRPLKAEQAASEAYRQSQAATNAASILPPARLAS